MGLFEFITVYCWNWFVYFVAAGGLYQCWMGGLWGLFFADDDGLLTNECLKLWDGNNVEFPVGYQGMEDAWSAPWLAAQPSHIIDNEWLQHPVTSVPIPGTLTKVTALGPQPFPPRFGSHLLYNESKKKEKCKINLKIEECVIRCQDWGLCIKESLWIIKLISIKLTWYYINSIQTNCSFFINIFIS